MMLPSSPAASIAPPDARVLAETVRTRLPFRAELEGVTPLAGDASNRRYFRLQLTGPAPSLVLMQLADPEAFKQSEEAVTGHCSIAELPFINVLDCLAQSGIPVPRLYHYDADAGLLYLEDFGDETLAGAVVAASAEQRRALYREAVEVLVRMQAITSASPSRPCVAFQRRFDAALLMWEFDHFLEYGVEARQGGMPVAEREAIRREFRHIAETLAAQPQVFTHRDYHSRNIMVRPASDDGRLGVIDFQDALLGPVTYDLASLLRDAYVELDDELVDELVRLYAERVHAPIPRLPLDELRWQFDLMSLQRNLKAAGRFVYIDRVKGNPRFLADVPRVLGYVRRTLARHAQLGALRRLLPPYVPELQ